MIIPTRNILADNAPKTFTTFPEIAGTNILRWNNPSGFNASWAIQVGETGEQQSEIVILGASTPSGTAGTLTANTLYPHPTNTPLYAIKYDQVVFERSTAGTLGTAIPLSGGTVTLQVDGNVTQFDDTSGSTSYAYKTFFRSSALSVNSTESDWITSSGFSFYSLAALRNRAKDRLWNANYLSDLLLNDWVNEWKDELTNGIISLNEDYALGTVDVAFGTAGLGTITTADFKQVKRIWTTFNGVDYFKSTKMDSNDYIPNQTFSTMMPYHYYQGDTVLGIQPNGQAGTARLEFYRFGTTMVNDTDELPQPFRSYTKTFMDYMENLALKKDGKYQESQGPLQEANIGKARFIIEMTPRDKTGPQYVDLVEPIDGDDYYSF